MIESGSLSILLTIKLFKADYVRVVHTVRGCRGHWHHDHRKDAEALRGPPLGIEIPLHELQRLQEWPADVGLIEEYEAVVSDQRRLDGGRVRGDPIPPEQEPRANLVDRRADDHRLG